MANDLINAPGGLPGLPLQQHAEKIVNVEHANTIQTQNTIYISAGLPGMPGYNPAPVSFSRDYFNLIVYGDTPLLSEGHMTFEKKRCLVEYDNIEAHLKARFSPLTPEIIEELKSFLCIVACENRHYGWTDDDHYASVAQLVDVKNRSNGIEIYFRPIFAIPQARLNEIGFQLGMRGTYRKFNELNHSHWTVKAIDLLEVLNDAGLNPLNRG